MKSARVLIVDDERNFRDFLGEALEAEGYAVATAATAAAGLRRARDDRPEIVLLDQNLPDGSGLALLHELQNPRPGPVVVMITAYPEYHHAVRAIKGGAFHYLTKPFEFSELLNMLQQAGLPSSPVAVESEPLACSSILGETPALRRLKEQMQRIAAAPVSTVLITGESGTGKELVAQGIHALSESGTSRMVSVNCVALTDTLLMSELFGHERGAFTDARQQKVGLFEAAQGGTLFLDEISEMGLWAQTVILRVLEQRTITRVGGTKEIPVDVRVIAATNRSLEQEVAQGRFRKDLYYRLNVVPLSIPPLRDRRGDIPLLAQHFLDIFAARYDTTGRRFGEAALAMLLAHDWPGNVRELRNVCERTFVLASSPLPEIQPHELPLEIQEGISAEAGAQNFQEMKQHVVDNFEKEYISSALTRARGNVSRAAAEAGVLRQVFQRLMTRHAIAADTYRRDALE
jgi:DNA-binding NtrC family response regulator